MSEAKTVAIIGAGPVGLAAAAHVLERGLRPIVLEAGDSAGHSVRQWGHVQLFSPWEYNIDRAAARLLAPTGWNSPEPDQYPTGAELVERYLEPLATKTVLATHIHTSSRVTDISRVGFDKLKTKGREAAPFEIRYQNGQGPGSCGQMPSSTHPAPGIRPIRPAPTASAPSANNRPPTGSLTACRMCWAKTARAMPANRSRCSAPDIPRSERSPISRGSRNRRRKPGRSGCCGATIRQRLSAAAPTTSSPPAASLAPHSPRWLQPVK